MGNWKTKKDESDYNHQYYLDHLWSEKDRNKKWYAKNREKVSAKDAKRYWADAEAQRARVRTYRSKNIEKTKAATKRWASENSEKVIAHNAARRARRLKAIPLWVNKFFVGEAYDLARRRTKVFGFKWHVDHIVPLKSKIVCGLHVEHNLQVIPGAENIRKLNRSWPDMPGV